MEGNLRLLTGTCEMPSYPCFKELLFSFAAVDNDFNGKNGPEYLWPKAKAANVKSNAEYAWAVAKGVGEATHSDDAIFEKFIDVWMKSDSYYERYELSIMHNENGEVSAVALAYVEVD